MQLISRQTIQTSDGTSAPLCAFVTYIDAESPVLLRRTGLAVGVDIHNLFSDSISDDNGKSWSWPQPQPFWSAHPEGDRFLVHTENSALFLPESNTLFHFTNDLLEKALNHCEMGAPSRLRITSGPVLAVAAGSEECRVQIHDFGQNQGVTLSFCNPIVDSKGRILLALQRQKADEDGELLAHGYEARPDMPRVLRDYWETGLVIGEALGDGDYHWRMGGIVPFDVETTTRGLCEGAFCELTSGRFAMILRGSNNGQHMQMPGYKWLSFSDDGGESWSVAQPLAYNDGTPVESSATGSALFRSQLNGCLYWIGNPCDEGVRVSGSWPRTPLVIAKVQEEPFVLMRDSIFVVDRAPDDNPYVQHSNFKFYQDRATGEIVIYLTRFGERGAQRDAYLNADLYEYRIGLDG